MSRASRKPEGPASTKCVFWVADELYGGRAARFLRGSCNPKESNRRACSTRSWSRVRSGLWSPWIRLLHLQTPSTLLFPSPPPEKNQWTPLSNGRLETSRRVGGEEVEDRDRAVQILRWQQPSVGLTFLLNKAELQLQPQPTGFEYLHFSYGNRPNSCTFFRE